MRPLNEYQRVCPTCSGTGINPVRTRDLCPKCKGEKIIPKPVSFRG